MLKRQLCLAGLVLILSAATAQAQSAKVRAKPEQLAAQVPSTPATVAKPAPDAPAPATTAAPTKGQPMLQAVSKPAADVDRSVHPVQPDASTSKLIPSQEAPATQVAKPD